MVYAGHAARAAREQRRLANAFRNAGALAPEHAKTLAQLGLTQNRFVASYVDKRIIREVRTGEFYLDDDAFRQYQAMVRRWLIVPLAVLIALLIYAIVSGNR